MTDNTLRGPGDYEQFTITAPQDPRLPGGGGYPITLLMVTQAAADRGAQNYVTFETDFGPERTQYWHGVDFTLNARLRQGLTLQFGTQTGRAVDGHLRDRRGTSTEAATSRTSATATTSIRSRRRSADWRRTRFRRSTCSSAARCARSRRSSASPPGRSRTR